MKRIIAIAVLLTGIAQAAGAYDVSKNPDRVASFGLDLWKGQAAGLDRETAQTTGGLVGGHFDFRQPVTNALTIHAFAESEGIDNNMKYTDGYRIGVGMRVFLQN